MAVRCSRVWSSKHFHYNRNTRTLVSEASTIQQGRALPLFGQIYDDACDEGFAIVSRRTGREVVFVVEKIDRDDDGDIVGWWLKTAERKDAALGIKVLVIND